MKSIRSRIIVAFAASATVTVALLFLAGYVLLERHLVHGLDLLNAAEFEQIRTRLDGDRATLTSEIVDSRIRQTTEYASVLFYITVDSPTSPVRFASSNLGGRQIPDVPGAHVYEAELPDIGPLRVGEFVLPPFDVTVATSLNQVQEVMRSYIRVCLGLLAGMLLASGAIGIGLSHLVLAPVRRIGETANRIGSETLGERIRVSDMADELTDLGRLLNRMFDRLQTAFDQIRRFTAEASHELKTPLSLMRLHAEKLLVEGQLAQPQEEAVLVLLEEMARLNRIIEDLLFLSRAEANAIPLNPTLGDPAAFLEGWAQDATVLAEHGGHLYRQTHAGEGLAEFAPRWVRQVLLNLLTNALAATQKGGTVALTSELDARSWRLTITDEGPGVPEAQLERIFERFVRLQPDMPSGNGLGLAICRSIVRMQRGRIYATHAPGGSGLTVTVELPRLQAAPA